MRSPGAAELSDGRRSKLAEGCNEGPLPSLMDPCYLSPSGGRAMLRGDTTTRRSIAIGIALCAIVGVAAAWLTTLGNPGNMGVCGACFLRDWAGALGMGVGKPAYLRPEILGVVLGALVWRLGGRSFQPRSGTFATTRLVFGAFM